MKKMILRGLVALAATLAGWMSSADETTEEDAKLAARGWSVLNGRTFATLGSVRNVIVEKDAQGKVLWYVVVMDGGAAVVSPDTEIEPVIAVMPGSDGIIPKKTPLDAMLRRDLGNRLGAVRARRALKSATPTAALTPVRSAAATKWDKLQRYSRLKMLNAQGNPATIVRWLDGWNSPNTENGVQTLRFWNQDDSPRYFTDNYVFNLYTPEHMHCGCVATAGAAIMHYFRAPEGAKVTRECMKENQYISLTTKGGAYDWSLIDGLTLTYGKPGKLPEGTLDLLARVASDCGIGCGMMYGKEGSGSYTSALQQSFRTVFGVKHAQFVCSSAPGEDIGSDYYEKIIYNQIRGGAPLAFGIDGHEVVACGYGFDTDGTDYTYIFLGWGGQNDAWYALPMIDTKATADGGWYKSTFVDELITSISFDDRFVAVCGQLIDIDGNPIAGGKLTMGNGEELTTDANGYWGTRVDPKDPPYVVDKNGDRHPYELNPNLTTSDSDMPPAAWADAQPAAMVIQLLEPSVTVYDGDSFVSEHGSVDRAVEKAATCAEPRIVITDRTSLLEPCTIGFDCLITATNADPSASSVVCKPNATLTVEAGARVLFSNVVFAVEAPFLRVETNGTAAVAGKVGLGEIATSDASGIELAGALESVGDSGLSVNCPSNSVLGQAFGTWTCSQADAEAGAPQFANAVNRRYSGLAKAGGQLVWQNLVSPGNAVARRIDDVLGEVNFAYLEDAFADSPDGGTITILRSCELGAQLELESDFVLRAADDRPDGVTVSLRDPGKWASGAFFDVLGSLTVENVRFDGGKLEQGGLGAFLVGWTGELILDAGAEIRNMPFVDPELDGVVAVQGGRLEMRDGSAIVNCRDVTDDVTAVNLMGTFDFRGGQITGGNVGVCASYGQVTVSGSATVTGNVDKDGNALNLGVSELDILVLTNELTGTIGVQVMDGDNALSNQFGVVAADFAVPPPTDAAAHFVNDCDPSLMGYATDDGRLVWVEAPPLPIVPVARVTSGGETVEFATADEAFAAVTDDAVVELLQDVEFTKPVVISKDVTLFSTNCVVLSRGSKFVTSGPYFQIGEGASLVVSNVTVNGQGDLLSSLEEIPASGSFFFVQGGELTLDDAVVSNFFGSAGDSVAAVQAADATFTMRNGAEICDCWNPYLYDDDELDYVPSHCGGVLAFSSVLRLQGGEISGCAGGEVGGVCLMDGDSVVEVSGDMNLWNNDRLIFDGFGDVPEIGQAVNLLVAGTDSVCLAGDLSDDARIYVQESIACTNANPVGQFGHVDSDYLQWASFTALTNGAACFRHEADDDVGCVVTNGDASVALLVWSTALDDGVYTDESGETFGLVKATEPGPTPPTPTEIDPPAAVTGLVYDGNEQTGVVAAVGFTLTGNIGTNAGPYTATATPADGYCWTGGLTASTNIEWSIAKATYDMSGVVFTNVTYVCDGTAKSNLVDEATLPAGVSVTNYLNNGQTEVDEYTVTAQFGGDDEVNYEAIPDMTATLTIIEDPTPPDPPPGPTPEWTTEHYTPSNIAFKAIERVSDTLWHLVITDRTEYCNYRLLWTDDLTKGFTSTGAWEHAVGDAASKEWTTNVITTGGAWFWRAEGTEGTNMVPPQVSTP